MHALLQPGASDALLIVDVQNDFCAGGALEVDGADDVIPAINRLAGAFRNVLLTQDWHPANHLSFASSHPRCVAFDTIEVPYGRQTLWPDHCVQGTRGADFHPRLETPHAALVLRKGFRREIDSYSAFFENDRRTRTGLAGYLRERGLTRLFLAGLAFDFCVRYSSEDAASLGFETFVVEDACRPIDRNGSLAAARAGMRALEIACISSTAIDGG
ncbi:bifunctional nicotinamidase/pyrazinamidase [Methylocystis echinoides]|uniref:Nicotinamidase n=1 Tax=Methylocystis echinoides TaxID=29468 RepID=A0A9W6GSX2_9HYPH|nr:bifunctional nicotinamidase/pyrazinamidase [Methylocystis echinoides]GLI92305.1 nicotinamidase [Methylocystis echinoides]